MNRRLLKSVLWFALLHYLAALCLAGIIFLVSHVPPKAVNLDGLMVILHAGQSVLAGPRKLLLWAYPGEATPGWLGPVSTVLNSLVWGVALSGAKLAWRTVTK